eukprot:PITA_05286
MENGKVPYRDGFNVDFFKACWSIVKQDILNMVEDSRNKRIVLKVLNTSFISLIPKQDNAMTPDRFRPIALCNVVYKIISKIIANRLKPLLPALVSVEQTRYVEGRQILNNIIQAHEVVHSFISKRQAGMVMKLELEKTYDKLNWAYIRKVLLAYGFDHNWEPKLLREEFGDLKHDTDTKGLFRVNEFWDQTNSGGKWRTWREMDYRDNDPLKAQADALTTIPDQRKILISTDSDQLRWGNNNEGNFNLKEAKRIALELDSTKLDRVWKNLWKNQGWMKTKFFMWLVHHKKILTWENIRKRGVSGPLRCQLCDSQEETMEHLLNRCIFTSTLWDGISSIFRQIDRDKGSITNTLRN